MADEILSTLLREVRWLHDRINQLQGDAEKVRCMAATFGDLSLRVVELLITIEDLAYFHEHGEWPPCSERRQESTTDTAGNDNEEEVEFDDLPF